MVRRCRFCQSAFELYCFWPGGKDPASQPGLDTQHSLFSIDKTTWGSNAPPSQPNFHGTSVSYAPLSAFKIESPSCYAPTSPVASSKIRPSIICPQVGSVTPITAKSSYCPLTSNRILAPPPPLLSHQIASSRFLIGGLTMPKVHLLDYVAGNIRSLVNAVEKLGYEVDWIRSPEDVSRAEVCITPPPPMRIGNPRKRREREGERRDLFFAGEGEMNESKFLTKISRNSFFLG